MGYKVVMRLFTGIVRDITQRKAVEQALVAAKELAEAASRAKDQFLAMVSHELRTPLTPILAAANLLRAEPSLSEEERLEELATIQRNAEHQARLVDDLLNLTRLNRGKIVLHPEVLNVHAALRSVLKQFQGEIEARQIELTLGLRAQEHHVWADPGRMQQVLSNILSNAVKFTPEGGRIDIRTSNLNSHLRIEIADNGVGIEPEALGQIFDPLEQGERTLARQYGGLRVGLAIARGIMDLHHGSLTARSAGRGRGATFTVELASMPAVSRRAERPAPPPGGAAWGRVLLVEDNPDTLRLLARLLRQYGFQVTTAMSVQEALTAAAQEHFDLLVSDIGLPDGSGWQIMRTLRDRQPIQGIAVSGYGQEEDLLRSREAGFADHLVKPLNFDVLASVIRRLAP